MAAGVYSACPPQAGALAGQCKHPDCLLARWGAEQAGEAVSRASGCQPGARAAVVDSRGGSPQPALLEQLVYAGSLTRSSYNGFIAAPSRLLCSLDLATGKTEPEESDGLSSVLVSQLGRAGKGYEIGAWTAFPGLLPPLGVRSPRTPWGPQLTFLRSHVHLGCDLLLC